MSKPQIIQLKSEMTFEELCLRLNTISTDRLYHVTTSNLSKTILVEYNGKFQTRGLRLNSTITLTNDKFVKIDFGVPKIDRYLIVVTIIFNMGLTGVSFILDAIHYLDTNNPIAKFKYLFPVGLVLTIGIFMLAYNQIRMELMRLIFMRLHTKK